MFVLKDGEGGSKNNFSIKFQSKWKRENMQSEGVC